MHCFIQNTSVSSESLSKDQLYPCPVPGTTSVPSGPAGPQATATPGHNHMYTQSQSQEQTVYPRSVSKTIDQSHKLCGLACSVPGMVPATVRDLVPRVITPQNTHRVEQCHSIRSPQHLGKWGLEDGSPRFTYEQLCAEASVISLFLIGSITWTTLVPSFLHLWTIIYSTYISGHPL